MYIIPFQKALVCAIVLSSLVLNVNGYDLLSHLRDAVLSAESFVGDIFKNVVQVVQHFRTFNDVFDAAVEEHCVFRCSNSKHFSLSLVVYLLMIYLIKI